MKHNIHPCFWYDGQARDAATFYCSVFKGARIIADTPMVVTWELNGQQFMGLNGGPQFKVNPSVSLFVVCETEEETNEIWHKLEAGGTVLMPLDQYEWSSRYGWVQDRFGLSWQIALGRMDDVGQKLTPSLLFTNEYSGKAEQAIRFYTTLFSHSSITGILKYEAGEDEPLGTVKHAQFTIDDYVMMAMDSFREHSFTFSEGVSFVVECDTQEEIDHFWNNFAKGGQESMCGWIRDAYGVWWQVIPKILGELMSDPEKGARVVQAFLKMKKFDIPALQNA